VNQLQSYLLALAQGLFDALPIGGAVHRWLLPRLLDWPEPSPAADFAVHLGILIVIAAYVWRDLFNIAIGIWHILRGRRSPRARQVWPLALALVPYLAAGVAVVIYAHGAIVLTPVQIGWSLLGFGLLLGLGDRLGMTVRRIEHLSYANALVIGLLLAVSFIPGAGRTAMVVTAARWLGYERPAAARLSLILSVPVLLAGLAKRGIELSQLSLPLIAPEPLVAGLAAMIGAGLGITVMMSWIRRRSFAPFALYRILAGAGLLLLAYLAAR
jgi:undecaprenyl-diphosphatase